MHVQDQSTHSETDFVGDGEYMSLTFTYPTLNLMIFYESWNSFVSYFLLSAS